MKKSSPCWAVVCFTPSMQRFVVRRCLYRYQAEGHAGALKQLQPASHYVVIFDP